MPQPNAGWSGSIVPAWDISTATQWTWADSLYDGHRLPVQENNRGRQARWTFSVPVQTARSGDPVFRGGYIAVPWVRCHGWYFGTASEKTPHPSTFHWFSNGINWKKGWFQADCCSRWKNRTGSEAVSSRGPWHPGRMGPDAILIQTKAVQAAPDHCGGRTAAALWSIPVHPGHESPLSSPPAVTAGTMTPFCKCHPGSGGDDPQIDPGSRQDPCPPQMWPYG